ncbi:MAG: response regulator [Candidatus Aminicenantes bacterium]|nr:response regulator [Candidatus Aminicenantes bacterium]NIM78741.1 response regulator [Candidatus Aminicenantes bacterium]NIN17996.1 response regulator [Candidatus Aminicenantes bacterium]NIN41896.1 response regulator [Candidatus Aminicenantes bacterium]NIN84651.1 response regulator [Candidatus Aminicenantes bacterium]
MKKKIIHLVDDENIIHDIFKRIFKEPEYRLIISENKSQAKANHTPYVDVVIMDLMIPGTSGIEIFKELKKDDPEIRAIFLTAYGTIESAIEAIKLGAEDYLQKPFNNVEIRHKIDRLIKERNTSKENIQLKRMLNERFSFNNIIGKSRALMKTLSIVESVVNTNSTVLITGESGTGKELIAKAIFHNSSRRDKPFFSFNSSNIPPTLFESMLFGHKKGAFTGAYTDKKGIFEEADTGTLFLDEIANLDHETQTKILRVLEEKEIQPLGSNKSTKVDVRIIVATNVNLKEKVDQNEFREDLYYRLNIINIPLPPLRERKEDIPLLAEHFIKKYAKENNKQIQGMDKKFLKYLMDYDWPGNVRELENAIIRAIILTNNETLIPDLLPNEVKGAYQQSPKKGSFYERIDALKRQFILESLERNNWVQKNASKELGLKATTLSELMKRLNIQK